MRRKKAPKPATERDYDLSSTLSAVKRTMAQRTHKLAPLPVDPVRVWASMFTRDELAAIKSLLPSKRMEDLFTLTKHVRIRFPSAPLTAEWAPSPFNPMQVTIDLPNVLVGPRYAAVPIEELKSDPMKEELQAWFTRRRELAHEAYIVAERAEYLMNRVGTPRQLAQVWPELQGFMTADMRENIASAKVRSRMPDVAYHGAFARAQLAPLNHWISEALLLDTGEYVDGVEIA